MRMGAMSMLCRFISKIWNGEFPKTYTYPFWPPSHLKECDIVLRDKRGQYGQSESEIHLQECDIMLGDEAGMNTAVEEVRDVDHWR